MGAWVHQGGRRYTLLDHEQVVRGTFDRPNWTIKRAEATVGAIDVHLTGTGMLNRELTATATGHPPIVLAVDGLSWNGQVTLTSGQVWPIQRKVAGGLRWVIGDERRPLVVMWARHRRAELAFEPTVASNDPGLLPLMLLLMLHHVRGRN